MILVPAAGITTRPSHDRNPPALRCACQDSQRGIVDDFQRALQTDRVDGIQVSLALARPIEASNPHPRSGDLVYIDFGASGGTCRDIEKDAGQTVIPYAFPVAGAAGGEANGLSSLIRDQGMGLGPTHINAQVIFHRSYSPQ